MSRQSWQQVRRLFDGARGRPADEREEFLRRSCQSDGELLEEVRSLLFAHEEAESFLELPFARVAPEARETERPAGLLEGVDRYRLRRVLGNGGMGRVYLAERADEEYRGRVAVKLLRQELASEALERRFRRERQILADLDHPNIARLLDGGTTDDGRSFLVLEYVEGEPIDRYCDRRRLSVDERLRIFCKVCSAVHAAHQSLIVHRDLKPANILVTADGEPKLLDFGIAKLLAPDEIDRTGTATTLGLAPLTLEYASPEQLRRQRITTASDVYALGVLLYELLTGRRPFRLGDRPPDELIRELCERPPVLPSVALGRSSERAWPEDTEPREPKAIGRARATDLKKLRRRLAGDLDNIVLKALRKRPQHRYLSAGELARDIERHLEGLVVRARPYTLAYRAAKFVRRHRWEVAFTAAVFAALVGLSVLLAIQKLRIEREQSRTQTAMEFLTGLFDPADPEVYHSDPDLELALPGRDLGAQLTVRELLDLGARAIDERFGGDPELQAELKATLGRINRQLGSYVAAAPLLEGALDLRRRLHGPDHPSVAASLLELGHLHYDLGENIVAEARYREALATLERLDLGAEAEAEKTLAGLAAALRHKGEIAEAENVQQRALTLARRLRGDEHERVAANLYALGDLHRELDRHDAADASYREALAVYRQLYGEVHPRVAALLTALGLLQQQRGDFAAAEPLLLDALGLQRRIHGDSHPAVAAAQHALSALLFELGRFDEAERLCHEALAMKRRIYRGPHPELVSSLNLLCLLRSRQGAHSEAEAYGREALAVRRVTLPELHPWAASAHTNLAAALAAQGESEEAEEHYRQALAIFRGVYGESHLQVARVLGNLGFLLRRKEDLPGAETHYRQALAIIREQVGPDHPDLAGYKTNLAYVLRRRGEPAEAAQMLREALQSYRRVLGPEHPNVGLCLTHLAGAMRDQGDSEAAVSTLRGALAIYDTALPPGHPWSFIARGQLGELLAEQGRYTEAEVVLLATYEESREIQGPDAESTVRSHERLIDLYRAWERPERAAELGRQLP